MTLVSEWYWAMDLADSKGKSLYEMLDTMGSREYTLERAKAIVAAAARDIMQALAEQTAKKQSRRRRR